MSVQVPQRDARMLFLMLGYGAVLLFWMSLEDHNALSVSLLGAGAALLLSVNWILRRYGGSRWAARHAGAVLVAFGAVAGALANLITVLLMFFKTGWHSHLYPDYPPQMMLAMLARLPVWSLAGALFAVALALLWLARTDA